MKKRKKQERVSNETLEQLKDIVKTYDYDASIEVLRLKAAEEYQREGVKAPEASDENAYKFVQEAFIRYLFYGRKPIDINSEIDDFILLLEGVQDELSRNTNKHRLINELLKHGAHWADVESPSNIGALLNPDWESRRLYWKEEEIVSLQRANNTFNSRHKIRRNSKRKKK